MRRILLPMLAVATGLALVGCGGDGDSPPRGSTPTAATTTGVGGGSGGVAQTVTAQVASDQLNSVELPGPCTTVTLQTKLGDGDLAAAKAPCD